MRQTNGRALTLGLVLALASCSPVPVTRDAAEPSSSSQVAEDPSDAGCEGVVQEGTLPSWASDQARMDVARYVISKDELALGVLWADPLIAGEPSPDRTNNKILWVMNRPREGSDLVVTAVASGSTASPLTFTFQASSGPGEIYPTVIDLPEPGCWEMTLEWSGHETVVFVPYEPDDSGD